VGGMTKQKRPWFIAASAALLIATAVGASAARTPTPPAATSVASAIPVPALDRLVARLAAEARSTQAR
jgi:hypothetical protein